MSVGRPPIAPASEHSFSSSFSGRGRARGAGMRGASDIFLAKCDGMFYICSNDVAENARMSSPGVAKHEAKRPGQRRGAGYRDCAGKLEKAPQGIEKAGFTPGNRSVNRP